MDKIKDIEENGIKVSGKQELIKYHGGERLTIRQMVKAKCYDCMGYYQDGRQDCLVASCPLYPIMPCRDGAKYTTRTLSDEHKEKLTRNRAKRG